LARGRLSLTAGVQGDLDSYVSKGIHKALAVKKKARKQPEGVQYQEMGKPKKHLIHIVKKYLQW
jgi:hypothetical protein